MCTVLFDRVSLLLLKLFGLQATIFCGIIFYRNVLRKVNFVILVIMNYCSNILGIGIARGKFEYKEGNY